MLVALKKAGCGLALMALKRTGCDVWQLGCWASNVTASVHSDHLLHGHMLPVFFDTDQSHSTPCCAEIQPMSQQAAATCPYQYTRSSSSVPQMWSLAYADNRKQ